MHLILDLETLDTKPSAIVLSIGAVLFNQFGIQSEFYADLNFETQLSQKRTMSQSTLNWWMNQTTGRKFNFPTSPYQEQLTQFLTWLNPRVNIDKDFKAWGNGSGFDLTIIESLLVNAGLEIPWHYFQIRDLRTFREYVADGERIERDTEQTHNALVDARNQAEYVIKHMKAKNLFKPEDIPF